MGKHKNGPPDRWLNYSPMGTVIPGTQFLACKVPLKQTFLANLLPKERFGPRDLVQAIPKLALLIDLTNTAKYYSKWEFTNENIAYEKIFCPGQVLPPNSIIHQFFQVVDRFLQNNKDPDAVIAVHCTHGVNRTGYFICRYMIERLRIQPGKAVNSFKMARGHGIERQHYLSDLYNGCKGGSESSLNHDKQRGMIMADTSKTHHEQHRNITEEPDFKRRRDLDQQNNTVHDKKGLPNPFRQGLSTGPSIRNRRRKGAIALRGGRSSDSQYDKPSSDYLRNYPEDARSNARPNSHIDVWKDQHIYDRHNISKNSSNNDYSSPYVWEQRENSIRNDKTSFFQGIGNHENSPSSSSVEIEERFNSRERKPHSLGNDRGINNNQTGGINSFRHSAASAGSFRNGSRRQGSSFDQEKKFLGLTREEELVSGMLGNTIPKPNSKFDSLQRRQSSFADERPRFFGVAREEGPISGMLDKAPSLKYGSRQQRTSFIDGKPRFLRVARKEGSVSGIVDKATSPKYDSMQQRQPSFFRGARDGAPISGNVDKGPSLKYESMKQGASFLEEEKQRFFRADRKEIPISGVRAKVISEKQECRQEMMRSREVDRDEEELFSRQGDKNKFFKHNFTKGFLKYTENDFSSGRNVDAGRSPNLSSQGRSTHDFKGSLALNGLYNQHFDFDNDVRTASSEQRGILPTPKKSPDDYRSRTPTSLLAAKLNKHPQQGPLLPTRDTSIWNPLPAFAIRLKETEEMRSPLLPTPYEESMGVNGIKPALLPTPIGHTKNENSVEIQPKTALLPTPNTVPSNEIRESIIPNNRKGLLPTPPPIPTMLMDLPGPACPPSLQDGQKGLLPTPNIWPGTVSSHPHHVSLSLQDKKKGLLPTPNDLQFYRELPSVFQRISTPPFKQGNVSCLDKKRGLLPTPNVPLISSNLLLDKRI